MHHSQRVYTGANGHAEYWLTKEDGTIIYRMVFNSGTPVFTNSMDVVHEKLKPRPIPVQLQLVLE